MENQVLKTAKEHTKKRWWIILLAVLVILLIALLILAFINNRTGRKLTLGADRSVAYTIQSRDHINPGEPHPPYNSNPPTSGWHYPNPAFEDFYDHTLPDEQLVHNLEHGDIWISYRSTVPASEVNRLKEVAGNFVIVTMRDANNHDIAVAAWGRLDTFDVNGGRIDMRRIENFINRYEDEGPEKVNHP